jgi:type II secretory pathway pseudopilin PulG
MTGPRRRDGITLLEITLVIGLLAILAAVLATRLDRLQVDAERAAMAHVLHTVKSVIALQFASYVAEGRRGDLGLLVGTNPMELLSTPPVNYLGSMHADDPGSVRGGHWYFDEDNRFLIYRVQNACHFESTLAGPPRARFKIRTLGADGNRRAEGIQVQGLTVSEVESYEWIHQE